jgi:hypothetical protein
MSETTTQSENTLLSEQEKLVKWIELWVMLLGSVVDLNHPHVMRVGTQSL